MAMGTMITAAMALAALNVLLLVPLTVIWVRNYSTFRTTLVLGLLAFAVAMLAENVIALYFFFSMQSFYGGAPGVQKAVLVLRGLQFFAILVLTYSTWK